MTSSQADREVLNQCCLTGVVFLVLSAAALGTGIIYPEWYLYRDQSNDTLAYNATINITGLWQNCTRSDAEYSCSDMTFANPEENLEWFITQILMIVSGGLAVLSLLFSMLLLPAGLIQAIGALSGGAGLTLFALDQRFDNVANIGWAFWTAVGGLAVLLLLGFGNVGASCSLKGGQSPVLPCCEKSAVEPAADYPMNTV